MLIQVTLADDNQWQCSECQRWLPFTDGQDDDFPGWCDECWTAHEAAKKEEVPAWFADDPSFPPPICPGCGNKTSIDGLCLDCWGKRKAKAKMQAAPMKQQMLDALCGDNYDRSDQWHVTWRHVWDSLED
jgi:predicted amidophosphoribosyltransferase